MVLGNPEVAGGREQIHKNLGEVVINATFALRPGLATTICESARSVKYLVRDLGNDQVWSLGEWESMLLSQLSEGYSIEQSHTNLANSSSDFSRNGISLNDCKRATYWFLKSGIIEPIDEMQNRCGNADHVDAEGQSRERKSNFNPLSCRIPIQFTTKILNSVAPWFRSLTGPWFFVVWILIVAFSVFRLVSLPEKVANASQCLYVVNNWFWLAFYGLILKAVHELGHGVFCRRHGGRVRESGVLFILMSIPLPFVDVSSSNWLRSRWNRIKVAAAGMYVEIFLGAVALAIWSYSSDSIVQFHLFNFALAAMIVTVVFNANVLMKFDGYFILSDLMSHPNLYQDGQAAVWETVFGANDSGVLARNSWSRRMFLFLYGIAAISWRVVVSISLIAIAANLFYGFGIVLSVLAIITWLLMPTVKIAAEAIGMNLTGHKRVRRIALTVALLFFLIGALYLMPSPGKISLASVITPIDQKTIYADEAGVLRLEPHMQDGTLVSKGERIGQIENKELVELRNQVRLRLEASQIRARVAHRENRINDFQNEQDLSKTIQKKLDSIDERFRSCIIRAPVSGRLSFLRNSQDKEIWLKRGGEIVTVSDRSKVCIRVYTNAQTLRKIIESDELPRFKSTNGEIEFQTEKPSFNSIAGDKIDNRLYANNGGPHASIQTDNGPRSVEKLVEGTVEFSNLDQFPVTGITGTLSFSQNRSVLDDLVETISRLGEDAAILFSR